jgi:hypothetical protein
LQHHIIGKRHHDTFFQNIFQLAMLPAGFVVPMGRDEHLPIDTYFNTWNSMGKAVSHG